MRNPGITSRLRTWLNNTPIKDPVDRRMAALLQVILIGFIAIIVIASGANLLISQEIPWQANVIRSSIAILIVGVPLTLLRRGYFRGPARIILAIFLILETYAATISSLREVAETLSIFTLGIVLAGLLIGRRALVLAFVWSAGVVVFSAYREQNAGLGDDGIVIAGNFILLNGLMGLFIDRFGVTLRQALSSSLERETELQIQIEERKRADKALRESEERYRKLIDHARDVIFTVSREGEITSLNPSFETFTGWPREEWFGRPFEELIAKEDVHRARDQFNRILVGQTLRALRLRVPNRAGEIMVVEMNISPQVRDGQVVGLLGIARDMTEEQRALDALEANEKRFRALVEHGIDQISLLGADGDLLYENPTARQPLGYSNGTHLGRNLFEFVHPDDQESAKKTWESLLNEPGSNQQASFRLRHADGSYRWMEGTATNLLDEPAVQAIVFNYRDVTNRKMAEETLRRQTHRLKILREIDSAILAADSVENIGRSALVHVRELIHCQRASLTLVNLVPEEAIIYDVDSAFETSLPKGARIPLAPFKDVIQTLSEGNPIIINDLTELPDPQPLFQTLLNERFRSICILPLFSQTSLIGAFSMSSESPGFFDEEKINLGREIANQVTIALTQSWLMEELQRLNTDLEQRVKERTDQLEAALYQYDAANRELDAFSYSVSHDLRAPLRAIDGFSHIVMENYASQLPDEALHYLNQVRKGSERMGQLIDDLLELSRVTRRTAKFEQVNLSEIAKKVSEDLKASDTQRSTRWIIEEGLVARGDPGLLRIVLENLFNNAWKFTKNQGYTQIEFGATDQGGETQYFVRDNGAGFNMAYADKLFGAFQRLHTETEFEGTGVGLATVKRIISRHGGRVWADAEAGKGATFYFTVA